MAFQATHVRFAHDLKELLQVQDESAYYTGSVYPDSRYLTEIARHLTHTETPYHVHLSDFEKGWHTHLMYDRLVGARYLPAIHWQGEAVSGLNAGWQQLSGAKLAEDQISFDVLGANTQHLKNLLPPTQSPCDESRELLEEYYTKLCQLYQQKPNSEGYYELLIAFHVPSAAAKQVIRASNDCLSNTEHASAIACLYDEALQAAKRELSA